ncbi:CoA transferase [Castellaniella sp.]|uniref:CaiB/BaiF CoA transferase family protein n=1 Tax=Castellaniella sp. TaxID=1955812 RepID=UPI002AFE464B|nr:CoA transferase [Castellaniella sp.]
MDETFAPLAGLRVIEMSHMIMGPSCGMFLGFLGAEVIKIEPPGGDKTRNLGGMGRPMFPLCNRGKLSVQLDLKSQAGQDALHRLLADADIFVENFRDGSLQSVGADPAQLRTRYPQLIIASCKGFLSGPYQQRTALDETVQMMTGLAYMTGPRGRPLRVGSSANDIMGGLFAAFSVLAALLERQHTRQGRALRTGLFENCLLLVAQHMVQYELEGENPPPMPEREFSWPIYDIFNDVHDKPYFLGVVTEGHWHAMCLELNLQVFLHDTRLKTRMDRIRARQWTIPLVAEKIAGIDMSILGPRLESLGIPFAPVARPCDMYDDPHVMRPGGLLQSHCADGSSFRAPALPFEVDGRLLDAAGDVAAPGRDTDQVLSALGLSAADIAQARGCVA